MDRIIDRYTEQELEKLQEVLSAYHRVGYTKYKYAKLWLNSYDNYHQRDVITLILDEPIEKMPLLINSHIFLEKILSRWRLKIGR